MGEVNKGKMDWLKLESRIRNVLYDFYVKGNLTAKETVDRIDDIVGEETGRGFAKDLEGGNPWWKDQTSG